VTTRTDLYLSAVAAVILLMIGLTILITGTLTSAEVGPTIVTGTAATTIGALASLVTGYRAARHHIAQHTNRAAAELLRNITAHDAQIRIVPPESDVVPIGQQRRRSRETHP